MTKSEIVAEIRRTAAENGGMAFGYARFESATGIKYGDWFGVYWARWSDAIREAGFEPNQLQGSYEKDELLQKYAELAKELGHLPGTCWGDLRYQASGQTLSFPVGTRSSCLGRKADSSYAHWLYSCRSRLGFEKIIEQMRRLPSLDCICSRRRTVNRGNSRRLCLYAQAWLAT